MATDLEENILLHLLLSASPSLLVPPQNTCMWSSLFLHLLACCSLFLVLFAALCGEMLINPFLLDQTMACFQVTSSILWPPSHVEKLFRKGQLCASYLPGDPSSSIYPDYLCDSENWLSGNGNGCIKIFETYARFFMGKLLFHQPENKQKSSEVVYSTHPAVVGWLWLDARHPPKRLYHSPLQLVKGEKI